MLERNFFIPLFGVCLWCSMAPITGNDIGDTGGDCKPSEFECSGAEMRKSGSRRCISLDRYCNGLQDCEDNSDEPTDCSPCNRTYLGEVGRTYELEVKRPQELQLPYVCHLNFTAAGRNFGELVQLSFESFSVGTFESFTSEGCPDGYISIAEANRPPLGGKWCGSSWGYTVYYSETSSINLTLHLQRLPQQLGGSGGGFEFKLSYKFLRVSDARIRYGNASQRSYRGKLHGGTYCDRLLEGCNRKPCRIQSPNYPGIYPRNVTCTYRVRDKSAAPDQHALIAVRHAHYKDHQVTKFDASDRVLRIWDQCNVMQDYVEILDGWEENAPVLAHLCSGESVPEIISSGPELTVRFRTSPFGNPFHPLPLSYLPGFELEVQVFYVNKASPTYREAGKKCEFIVTSSTFENPAGILHSPMHSLPPNTTCNYRFRGQPNEIIWVSFIKYHVTSSFNSYSLGGDCDVQLQLWDGDPQNESEPPLLGQFCKDDKPKLCDHSLLSNASRKTRPCALKESYVSSGPLLTITHSTRYGNVIYPASFLMRYEFVDLSQEGVQISAGNPCDRVFKDQSGKFGSPRITFLYGRGGQKSLSCQYHFEGNDKRLLLNFLKIGLGKKKNCRSFFDDQSERYKCQEFGDGPMGQIRVSEFPWAGVEVTRDCLCGNFSDRDVSLMTKTGRKVVVSFSVTGMGITDDYKDFYFDASYEFQERSERPCLNPWNNRRLKGSSGEITLRNKNNQTMVYCTNQPWLIEPENPHQNYLYLKIKGFEMTNDTFCGTRNRILVHSPSRTSRRIICPEGSANGDIVELFSEGWAAYSLKYLHLKHVRSFVIEFLQREPGNFAVNWIEVSKNPAVSLPATLLIPNAPNCPHSCPELGACISPELWCDGLRHCPSGSDEQEVNCAMHNGFPLTVLTVAVALIASLTVIILASGASLCFWRHRRREEQKSDVIVSVTEHTFLEFKSGYC